MKKSRLKIFRNIVLFLFICIISLSSIQKVVTAPDYKIYQWIHEFYKEPEASLDAVYIGSSAAYSLWVAPLAWENYGIAVWPYTTPGQPLEMAEVLIREARKTQPDALYIVCLNYKESDFENTPVLLHRITDYMPFSINKLSIIDTFAEYGNYDFGQKLEFVFPIMKFHSRWKELVEEDFQYSSNELKGGPVYSSYLKMSVDVASSYRVSNKKTELSEELETRFLSLLEYCKNESVELLFVVSPQMITDDKVLSTINTLKEHAIDYEFPVLDMINLVNEMSLDLSTDYIDTLHTNIHGGIKTTNYLAKYLVENYGFMDKRGKEDYSSWDAAVEKYHEIIGPHVLPEESKVVTRDYTLEAPVLSKTTVLGNIITLSWEGSEGAEGYAVYRKELAVGRDTPTAWKEIARVDAETLSYEDTKLTVGTKYTYTVVPLRMDQKEFNRLYGKYNISGISATALLSEPEQIVAEGECNNVTVKWDEVDGAENYQVYRRVNGKSWVRIADVENATTYTDTEMAEGLSYQYRIRAYYTEEDGTIVYGSYGKNDCLWLGNVEAPVICASYGKKVVLNWETVEGINFYRLYRRSKNGEWEEIKAKISSSLCAYNDSKVEVGETYEYKLSAVISFGGEEYEYASNIVEITCQK